MCVILPQRRSDAGTFHVQTFLLKGCGATGGEVAAAPLRHVWNSNGGRAAYEALEDGKLFK